MDWFLNLFLGTSYIIYFGRLVRLSCVIVSSSSEFCSSENLFCVNNERSVCSEIICPSNTYLSWQPYSVWCGPCPSCPTSTAPPSTSRPSSCRPPWSSSWFSSCSTQQGKLSSVSWLTNVALLNLILFFLFTSYHSTSYFAGPSSMTRDSGVSRLFSGQ